MRIILMGNAGAGKSTMARALLANNKFSYLSLDHIAWEEGTVRKPIGASIHDLLSFIDQHHEWVIEGCYGELIEVALPFCTELRFLNPGTDVCVRNSLNRHWEPDKFASPHEQKAMLDRLIDWIQRYETREDEFGLKRHRTIFDNFPGPKCEYDAQPSQEAQ